MILTNPRASEVHVQQYVGGKGEPRTSLLQGQGLRGGRGTNIHLFLEEDGAFQVSVNLGKILWVLQVD